jgi:hypothetical protein
MAESASKSVEVQTAGNTPVHTHAPPKPDSVELWRIYAMLTNLEAVFRSLKTDLGLRPVHHHNDGRVEGCLFISLLAYYAVHTLRVGLKAAGAVCLPKRRLLRWEFRRETLVSYCTAA